MVTGKWQIFDLTGKKSKAWLMLQWLQWAGGIIMTRFQYLEDEMAFWCDVSTHKYVTVTNSSIFVLLISSAYFP